VVSPRSTRTVGWTVTIWLALAVFAGTQNLLEPLLPPPLPLALIAALTVAILTVAVTSAWFRQWLMTVDVRALVLVHVTRFAAGLSFLVLYGRGALPYAFAVPGGVGDIIVAVMAIGVVLATDGRSTRGRWLLGAWNLLGLADILMVVATAVRIGVADPGSMAALLRLPLSLLPTWLVPIIIATHLIIFVRILRRRPSARVIRSGRRDRPLR
jgi:hypothetical protein